MGGTRERQERGHKRTGTGTFLQATVEKTATKTETGRSVGTDFGVGVEMPFPQFGASDLPSGVGAASGRTRPCDGIDRGGVRASGIHPEEQPRGSVGVCIAAFGAEGGADRFVFFGE